MTPNSDTLGQQRRITWLSIVFAAMGLILLGRLAWWQLVSHPEVMAVALSGTSRSSIIPAARGSILDANGQYLAVTNVDYTIGVSPKLLSATQKEKLTPKLASILGLPEDQVARVLATENTEYALLGKGFSVWVAEQLETLEERGAFVTTAQFSRRYPDGSLAASVLGFLFHDGSGQYGLEQLYDKILRGVDGNWSAISDPWGNPVLVTLSGYQPTQDGADLVLTLDRNIQHAAEAILREGIESNKASAGNIIVLDPRTGAVLAMANYPSYEPQEYGKVEDQNQYINTAISAVYEPGSVFKPLTLASALEARVILPTDTYDDRGEIIVGGQRILNSDRQAHGRTTMTELLAYSRNVGAAHVASLLGPTRFYEMLRRFGLAEVTGIDLALEVPGVMRTPGNPFWHMSDLGTNSFGQGIAVTPMQVVAAFGALANDGVLLRPYIVSEIRQQSSVERREPFTVRRVVSPEVARQMSEMMANAVELGMKKALVPGYRLAGKSGTSGIPDQEGYRSREVIASFVGYGPLPNPRFVILVRYDRPKEGYWGLDVAAPAFAKMAKFLIDYYGIPPAGARVAAQ